MPHRTLALSLLLLLLLPASASAAEPRLGFRLDVAGATARATTTLTTAAGRTTSATRRVRLGRCTRIGRHLGSRGVAAGPVRVTWSAVRIACGARGRIASLTLVLPEVPVPALRPGRCFLGALDMARSTRAGAVTLEATAAVGSRACTALPEG